MFTFVNLIHIVTMKFVKSYKKYIKIDKVLDKVIKYKYILILFTRILIL